MHSLIFAPSMVALLSLSAYSSTYAGSHQTLPTGTAGNDVVVSAVDAAEITRVLALSEDLAYGEYLAGECVSCHSDQITEGSNVPVIEGVAATLVVRALLEYRSGLRTNTTMGNVASSLGDEEVAVLAHYLASIGQ